MLALALACVPAQGAYLESDYDDDDTAPRPIEPPPGIIPPPRPMPVPHNAVTKLIQRVEIGRSHHYRGLTVFPLTLRRGQASHDIRTLDEALNHGWITIQEKGSAEVSTIRVRNKSKHLVLFMGGEIITGGKQNRVIKEDVLLPRRSKFIDVPVYCIEQERWSGKNAVFASGNSLAHQSLRASAAKGESQGAIWKEVDKQSARTKVSSRTRDYQEIYKDKAVRRQLDECVARLRGFQGRNTIGAVAVAGNRIIACDLFSNPVLFAKLWDKICRSYGMDAIALPQPRRKSRVREVIPVTEREIRGFLRQVLRARFRREHTPGAGRCLSINGAATGRALLFDDEVVHTAIFPGMVIRPLRRE